MTERERFERFYIPEPNTGCWLWQGSVTPYTKADAAHACGMRACCNPAHLRWDTRKGNMADGLTHGTRLLGERVTGAKLTAEQVIAIRSQPTRSQSELASEYGVQQSSISHIRNRKRWRHIP